MLIIMCYVNMQLVLKQFKKKTLVIPSKSMYYYPGVFHNVVPSKSVFNANLQSKITMPRSKYVYFLFMNIRE